MKLFLRLKHWQIFLLTWGFPIIIDVYAFSDPGLMMKLFPIMMTVFTVTFFGWIWAISTELNKLLPKDNQLNLTRFKIIFSVAIIYVMAINVVFLFHDQLRFPETILFSLALIPLHLFSLFSILYGCRFAGRTIKSIELGRTATDAESQREYGQVAILFIGIWTLQPKLNKIIEGH